MDNSTVPLFVQTGTYPARLDRGQTGSLLAPGGNTSYPMFPRAGVRPHGLNSKGEETALLVTADGGRVTVAPGVAFVGGDPGTQGIEGIYIAFVNAPVQPALPAPIPGADQYALVGIKVTDPDYGGTAVGDGQWAVVAVLEQAKPASHFLTLARVKIPGNGAVVSVSDMRSFTAALGGVVTIRGGLSDLEATFAGAPHGTQVYSIKDGTTYVRGGSGWAQAPCVATVVAGTPIGTGRPGQLLWDQSGDALYVYDVDAVGTYRWLRIAGAPASARTAYEQGWRDGPNEANISPISMDVTIVAGEWNSISDPDIALIDPEPGETKYDEKALILHVKSTSSKSYVSISMTADVLVQKASTVSGSRATLVPDPDNSLQIGVEVLFTPLSVLDKGVVVDESGTDGFYRVISLDTPLHYATWTGSAGGKRNFTVEKPDFPVGGYQIRPVFKSAKNGYFKITDLQMKVATK